jgi:manganese transport protein
MGVFANGPVVKTIAWTIFSVIVAANAWLLSGLAAG